jgi:hypothetical protein
MMRNKQTADSCLWCEKITHTIILSKVQDLVRDIAAFVVLIWLVVAVYHNTMITAASHTTHTSIGVHSQLSVI